MGTWVRGRPWLPRLGGGFRAPRHPILGADVAGTVVEVGSSVERLQPGDDVFGDISGSGWGGFGEYVSVAERVLDRKPASIPFDHAAAIPQAGVLALQALNTATIQPGQQVLIIGAGGGAGTFAGQLAKARGAEITAVDRGDKREMLHAIGADRYVDYTRDDFASQGQHYDLIVDMVMQRSLFAYNRSLASGGRFVVVGGDRKSTRLNS